MNAAARFRSILNAMACGRLELNRMGEERRESVSEFEDSRRLTDDALAAAIAAERARHRSALTAV